MTGVTERARALLAGITPGEWRAQQVAPRPGYETGYITVYSYASPYVCSVPGIQWDESWELDQLEMVKCRQSANAEFITAAPALVRDLLARCEALEAVTRAMVVRWEDDYVLGEYGASVCRYCEVRKVDGEVHHAPDCPVAIARALLGAAPD
jgi:hypothetical protein